MRNLKNTDLFKIMRILRKADFKKDLMNMKMPENVTSEQEGMMLILQFMESAPSAEKEIWEFLADVGGVKAKELENDEFEILPNIVSHLMKQDKLIDFLKQAFKSVN